MFTDIEEIYIPLINEGTDVWRPAKGRRIKDLIFEVLCPDDYDSMNEDWQFKPGNIVKCKKVNMENKEILVAIELHES